MKTIIIIFLVWCLVSIIIAFIYAVGYKVEDHSIRIEELERELVGLKKENEQLSLRVVEAEMGGFPHRAVIP